jgi:hypothetical protein
MKPTKEPISLKTKIEHISFQSENIYMDVESHEGYVDITIGGIENEKFSVTLEEWHIINKKVIEILIQK